MAKIIVNGDDFNWTEGPVLGATLIGLGGKIDSYNNKLERDKVYRVGKHKTEGQVVILPIEKETNKNNTDVEK